MGKPSHGPTRPFTLDDVPGVKQRTKLISFVKFLAPKLIIHDEINFMFFG
jgi:hypothetical protein